MERRDSKINKKIAVQLIAFDIHYNWLEMGHEKLNNIKTVKNRQKQNKRQENDQKTIRHRCHRNHNVKLLT